MSREEPTPRPLLSRAWSRYARWLRVASVMGATLAIAIYALRQVLRRCGHPAVPLDDAFIHFQYARRLAEGHGLSYVDGEGFSSGATSLLWPVLLAGFHALGLRDLAIVWGSWLLGFGALAGLAAETYRIARPLAGAGEASGAAAMVLVFGGHVWCAASGMEVVPLAWLLAYAVRVCSEWREAPPEARSTRQRYCLWAVALAAPLMRPEGALASLSVFAVLVLHPALGDRAWAPSRPAASLLGRRHALVALMGPLLVPAINWLGSGRATSSTTAVKWLPGNPYYGHGGALVAAVSENVRLLYDTLLDGREWSALFVPAGARPYAFAALAALPAAGFARGRSFRSMLVLVVALGMLIPCTYMTFLWNRLRYLWPFAFAWFIGLACAARSAAELLAVITPRLRPVGPCLSWLVAVRLATHLPWTTADLAESSSAIDRQQVALARWAARTLPKEALIGVNDTGAIAYLGGHPTFDVVGLTTPGEARYWVAGAGARFEHYERLHRRDARLFPTHFIVYPSWMACDAVLGAPLHEATVLDQTILGGTTMTAFTARRDLLDSGALPLALPRGPLIDELDVADLESEAAHAYTVGPSRETSSVAAVHELGGRQVADGVRQDRTFDDFRLTAAGEAVLAARLTSEEGAVVEAWANGTSLGVATLPRGGFTEVWWLVDGAAEQPPAAPIVFALRSRGAARFGAAHYWTFVRSPADRGGVQALDRGAHRRTDLEPIVE